MLTFAWAFAKSAATKAGAWLASGSRPKWAAGALTALLIAILIFQLRAAHADRDDALQRLEAAQGEIALLDQARSADIAALGSNAEAKSVISKRASVTRERTEAAMAAHPDWASQPVPSDIIDSLRE